MQKRFTFGKIDYTGKGRRAYPVEITVELRKRGGEKTFTVDRKTGERNYTGETTPEYIELAICGWVYNTKHTDCVAGGQCLDEIAKYRRQLDNVGLFNKLLNYWQLYHLNGTNAGTPEQEKAIADWKAAGNKYDYTAACEYLKSIGLYEVNYTGKAVGRYYDNEPYKYGHGWIIEELPADVLADIEKLLSE